MKGRPSTYTQEVADEICERLADGESLRSICAGENMPPESTVRNWVIDDRDGFAAQYARAREAQADTIFDEILEIADDARNDWMTRRQGDEDISVVNQEHIQRSRLRIDARKWMAGKLRPKVYGDKIAHTGPDGGPVQYEKIERTIVRPPDSDG